MTALHLTALDLLEIENPDWEDPFAAQLLQCYRTFLWDIINREGRPRQFTREEYSLMALFLSTHHGNPYGFLLAAGLRKSADDPLSFLTQTTSQRVLAGTFDARTETFQEPCWAAKDDPLLNVTMRQEGSFCRWALTLPKEYPHTLVLEDVTGGEEIRSYVMYQPDGGQTLLPGVFFPYDVSYTRIAPQRLDTRTYVVQKLRLAQQPRYLLSLGTFAQFAIEAFPVLCPGYRIPEREQEGEHVLELYLCACYGKHFSVGFTTFRAEDDDGISGRGMPDWAQRWMLLWRELPSGLPVGTEEILALLDLLWNEPTDARSILGSAMEKWLYGAIWGARD